MAGSWSPRVYLRAMEVAVHRGLGPWALSLSQGWRKVWRSTWNDNALVLRCPAGHASGGQVERCSTWNTGRTVLLSAGCVSRGRRVLLGLAGCMPKFLGSWPRSCTLGSRNLVVWFVLCSTWNSGADALSALAVWPSSPSARSGVLFHVEHCDSVPAFVKEPRGVGSTRCGDVPRGTVDRYQWSCRLVARAIEHRIWQRVVC